MCSPVSKNGECKGQTSCKILGILVRTSYDRMPFNPALRMHLWSSTLQVWEVGQGLEQHPWWRAFATTWKFIMHRRGRMKGKIDVMWYKTELLVYKQCWTWLLSCTVNFWVIFVTNYITSKLHECQTYKSSTAKDLFYILDNFTCLLGGFIGFNVLVR
jgi:hypothetical protein